MLPALGIALLLSGSTSTATPAEMPREIAAYYRDYNFVNAFSSLAERRVLAHGTTVPKDSRLASVAAAFARLAGQTEEELDPGIVYKGAGVKPQPRYEGAFGADILRVTSWSVDDASAEAWIDVEELWLDDEVTGLLVTHYDRLTQGGKRMPEFDSLIPFARRVPMRTIEKHHWYRVDGSWQRAAPVVVLTR